MKTITCDFCGEVLPPGGKTYLPTKNVRGENVSLHFPMSVNPGSGMFSFDCCHGCKIRLLKELNELP